MKAEPRAPGARGRGPPRRCRQRRTIHGRHDVEVPGVSPLIFRRVHNTRFLDRPPSVLGAGWVQAFEATLEKDLDGFAFEGHDGDRVEFDDVDLDFE